MTGLERIEKSFEQGKACVAYLTAGDGGIERTLEAALALIEGGITMLEIGMPFSDPIADGPVIQRAATRALIHGTTLQGIIKLTREIRKKSEIPLILFSYLNPVLTRLEASFFKEMQMAGLDGLLIVDCPMEESKIFHQYCLAYQIAPIYVITPLTSVSRMCRIDQYGKGFLYYVCRHGTTGMHSSLPEDFEQKMKLIKSKVYLPVVAGFGISSSNTVKKVLEYADGVVVGSLFVKALEDGMSIEALTCLARHIYGHHEVRL